MLAVVAYKFQGMQSTEIARRVRVSDILSIRTRNSVYEFFVIDPERAYGLVKGGVVGECPKAAFICEPTTLVPGLKARLLIETASGLRHITTSKIKTINRRS
jgi:hypothetical protein